ncbi:MAG TPA: acetate kinase [Alphaproteobacteria bacterium]|nr:acetate kinase [Alphaproteobacteria bacterium]
MSDGAIALALNSGSSSLKFGVYRAAGARLQLLFGGDADLAGARKGCLHVRDADGRTVMNARGQTDPTEAIEAVAGLLTAYRLPSPAAIGHRFVHGGPELTRHAVIDAAVARRLKAAAVFAPLHVPPALAILEAARVQFPGIPHVACLDTAFHAGLPEIARTLPLPADIRAAGVRRYGFHGLSCESIVDQLGEDLPGRLIVAHLGSGASITAIRAGRSVDTSMGLTPTGGVIMATRPGDLDPGVLVYLLRECKLDAAGLEELLDHHSGLAGISGIGGDMRVLHEAAPSNADARLAIEMFCYSVRRQVAAMIAALNGVDALVFTGGIGENDAVLRSNICAGLSWAGIDPDDPTARCAVRVLATREEERIAHHSLALTAGSLP